MYALRVKNGFYVGVQAQELSTATHDGGGHILVENVNDGAMTFPNAEIANVIKGNLDKSPLFEGLEIVPIK